MLFFTILRQCRRLCIGNIEEKDREPYECLFYSVEIMVARRNGRLFVFHVTEIRSESTASISGYCVEGEDQL